MKIGHLYLDSRTPAIRVETETAKNKFRGRTIMLNDTGLKYIKLCKDRASSLGSAASEHYLFPLRICTGHYDPLRPASPSWLRKPWEGLREATGLHWLTPHCLRHQHATISLETGESEFTVAKRMGHSNPTMLRERYAHARQDIQARAVANIDPSVRFAPQGVGVQKIRAIQ